MNTQFASKQFHAALSHLLVKEGRGSQSRLASEQNLDRGYLNAIVKGRKSGSEEVRMKIAVHFGTTYEDMLALGRRLLDGEEGEITVDSGSEADGAASTAPVSASLKVVEGGGADGSRVRAPEMPAKVGFSIAEKIMKVAAILESDTPHRDIMAGLIDACYEAIGAEKHKATSQNQIRELELRVASLEQELASEKERSRKCA